MPEFSGTLAPGGRHNLGAARADTIDVPPSVRNDLRRALVGTREIPRGGRYGANYFRVRYTRSKPIDHTLDVLLARLLAGDSVQQLLEYPEMLRSLVLSIGVAHRPLDVICERELSRREQCAQGSMDIPQLALHEGPTVASCREFLEHAASYRAELTTLEAFCHAFIAQNDKKRGAR